MEKDIRYFIKSDKIDYIISLFLGMYLFGFFINSLTFIKYIGLYGAILFFVIGLFYDRKNYYKVYYDNNKILFFALLLFIFSIILSILFAYSDVNNSIREFRRDFLNISIFILITLFIRKKNFLFYIFIYSIMGAFIFDIVSNLYEYYIHNKNLNFSIRLNRNFANYFEIIYPFSLSFLFILKNRLKYMFIIIIFLGLFELVLTGARGAWISVISETFIFFILLMILKKEYIKTILISFIFIMVGNFLIFNYMYKHSSFIKNKINQGLTYTSGRDEIIKTRLPIFLKHGNFFIGIGGPDNYQYNKFLNTYKAKHIYGYNTKIGYHYLSDEPFLLQIFYKEGIIGVLTFLFLSGVFLWKGFFYLKSYSKLEYKIFVVSIISSFVGYYLIRGLVEGRELKYIVLFIGLYLFTKENSVKNS